MNVVIDTNVVVAGLRSRRGASNLLLTLIGSPKFSVQLSVPLFFEYEEKLRTETDLSEKDVLEVLSFLYENSQHHKIYFKFPNTKDDDDAMILELAVKSQSPYIITFNVKDFLGCENYGIKVLKPRDFLKQIGEIE